MAVTKSSDLIYSYQSMRAAWNAAEDRFAWEENGTSSDEEPPDFEDFMKKEYNDPRSIDWIVSYRCWGDEKDYTLEVQAHDLQQAAAIGRNLMDDVAFIRFDVRQKCYAD